MKKVLIAFLFFIVIGCTVRLFPITEENITNNSTTSSDSSSSTCTAPLFDTSQLATVRGTKTFVENLVLSNGFIQNYNLYGNNCVQVSLLSNQATIIDIANEVCPNNSALVDASSIISSLYIQQSGVSYNVYLQSGTILGTISVDPITDIGTLQYLCDGSYTGCTLNVSNGQFQSLITN